MGKKAGNLAYLGGNNTAPIPMTTLNQGNKNQGDGWLSACLLRQLFAFKSRHLSKIKHGRHQQKSGQHPLVRQKICKKIFLQLTSKPLQPCTATKKYRYFETNVPRKGISGSHSQFLHSCVCERFIYSHEGSAYSAGGNMQTAPGTI